MKNKKKLMATILAMTVVATGALSAVGCGSNKDKQSGENSVEDVVNDTGGMELEENESSVVRMKGSVIKREQFADYGVSEGAETAYTITATIEPEYMASLIELEWTAHFARENVGWAAGKDVNDYIKITPVGDLSHQAVVECIQGFGAEIIIKATAKNDVSIFGTCTAEYITRYQEVDAKLDDGTSIQFIKDQVSTFTFEATNQGSGKVTFTGFKDGVGTRDGAKYGLSMEIDEVLAQSLENAGFTVYDTTVSYGTLYTPQIELGYYGFDTMLYLPGADAAILGEQDSELIRQAYLWITTGTNDDGVLSEEEKGAYNRYRAAIMSAWQNSDDFLITLVVTHYDNDNGDKVLGTYEAQMDFAANELFPTFSVGNVTLDFGVIEF